MREPWRRRPNRSLNVARCAAPRATHAEPRDSYRSFTVYRSLYRSNKATVQLRYSYGTATVKPRYKYQNNSILSIAERDIRNSYGTDTITPRYTADNYLAITRASSVPSARRGFHAPRHTHGHTAVTQLYRYSYHTHTFTPGRRDGKRARRWGKQVDARGLPPP